MEVLQSIQLGHEAAPSIRSAWDAFNVITGSRDYERFRQSFIGSWASRVAFGDSLLEEFGAPERLQSLPPWLQPYVRLDSVAIVVDFEAAGYYQLAELPGVVHVFDRPALLGRAAVLAPGEIQWRE